MTTQTKKILQLILIVIVIMSVSKTSFSQIPNYVDTGGLISWYSFTGNTNDSSGHNLNGTIYGSVTLTTDRFGNPNSAYSFDGTTGYIGVPSNNLLKLSNQYSISGWFYPTTIQGHQRTIISQSQNSSTTGLCLNLDDLQNYTVFCDNTDSNGTHPISADTTPSIDTWYNSVVTYDGDSLKIYANGVLKNTLPDTINLSNNLHILTIGSQHVTNNSDDFFSGKIDDIGVWNRPLTQQEIQQLYTGVTPCTFYDTILVSTVDTLIINTSTGLPPPNNINILKVYPNPTHDHVEINTGNYSEMSGYTIKIVNTLSQTVFQNTINQQLFNISLSGWSNGVYQIEIFNSQSILVETKELVLE